MTDRMRSPAAWLVATVAFAVTSGVYLDIAWRNGVSVQLGNLPPELARARTVLPAAQGILAAFCGTLSLLIGVFRMRIAGRGIGNA